MGPGARTRLGELIANIGAVTAAPISPDPNPYLEGLHGTAAGLGLEQLMLTTRGGTGVERFYEHFGYTIVGRHPGAIQLAPGDDRDELILVLRL